MFIKSVAKNFELYTKKCKVDTCMNAVCLNCSTEFCCRCATEKNIPEQTIIVIGVMQDRFI